MTTFRLAWRNLRRNKRRTVLTSLALTIGILVLIVSFGILDGTDQQSINNLVAYDLANVKAFAPGYMEEDFPDLDQTIAGADDLVAKMRSMDGVAAATVRLEMSGMLIYGVEETYTRVIGVDPAGDPQVFKTLDSVVKGRTIRDETPVALIGDRLADDLKLDVGNLITLLVRSAPGALNPRTLPIAGILSTGHPKVDQFAVYIPLSTARQMALLPDAATEIALRTERLAQSEKMTVQMARMLPDLDWRSWSDLAEDFINLARMKRTGSAVMIAVLVLMAAVGIANTMVISVHERIREIGALRALGFTRRQVKSIFLWEGALIGLIAGGVGVIIGVAIVSYLGVNGISLAMYGNMDIGYPVRDAIYPVANYGSVIGSYLFGFLLAMVASWGSAKRAARGNVVKALREGAL